MRASPLRRPSGERQSATPPLEMEMAEGKSVGKIKWVACNRGGCDPMNRLINGLHCIGDGLRLDWIGMGWGPTLTWLR